MAGRAASVVALLAAACVPETLGQCPPAATGTALNNCTITNTLRIVNLTMAPGSTYAFKVVVDASEVPTQTACPAKCPGPSGTPSGTHGVLRCSGPCPTGCFCVDGNTLTIGVKSAGNVSADLVLVTSNTEPNAADLAGAQDAYNSGTWTISGKKFPIVHKVNVGSKGHMPVQEDLVELCYPAWKNSRDASASLTGTKEDAECGCADCGTQCGLSGSRKATTCDDVACCSYSSGCDVGLARCIENTEATHTECDGALCGDQFLGSYAKIYSSPSVTSTPVDASDFNCTAYAASPEMMSNAAAAAYCCDIGPTELEQVLDGSVFFATGKGPGVNPLDQECDEDRSSDTFGYETAFDDAVPQVVECGTGDANLAGPHYVYALNTGSENITLAGLSYSVSSELTAAEASQCAHVAGWDATSSGRRSSVMLLPLLALTLTLSRWV